MKIKKIANDLTDWESNSRYGHSLVATRNEIEESLTVTLEMLNDIIEIENRIFPDLKNMDSFDEEINTNIKHHSI